MSTIRMSPEFIATLRTGALVRVVEGGAPMGAEVTSVRIEGGGVEGYPEIVVEVDDGIPGDRLIVFEEVEGRP